jgi:hypothetical protein
VKRRSFITLLGGRGGIVAARGACAAASDAGDRWRTSIKCRFYRNNPLGDAWRGFLKNSLSA